MDQTPPTADPLEDLIGSSLAPNTSWLNLAGDILVLAGAVPSHQSEAPTEITAEDPWAALPLSAQLQLRRCWDQVRGSEDGD